jgi:uncharacterized cupin superfamily protein
MRVTRDIGCAVSVDPSKYIVRAADRPAADAQRIRHPLNPASEIHMTRLSDPTGLTRQGVSMARVPPGKESFVLHAHTLQEEWVYVLQGRGHVQFGDALVAIESGDFIGFPTDGTPHVVRNTSDADLVFLQGGERREGDRGVFPTLGKVGYHDGDGHVALVPMDAILRMPFSAWMADD